MPKENLTRTRALRCTIDSDHQLKGENRVLFVNPSQYLDDLLESLYVCMRFVVLCE